MAPVNNQLPHGEHQQQGREDQVDHGAGQEDDAEKEHHKSHQQHGHIELDAALDRTAVQADNDRQRDDGNQPSILAQQCCGHGHEVLINDTGDDECGNAKHRSRYTDDDARPFLEEGLVGCAGKKTLGYQETQDEPAQDQCTDDIHGHEDEQEADVFSTPFTARLARRSIFLGDVIPTVFPVVVKPLKYLEIVLPAVDKHVLADAFIHLHGIVIEFLGLLGHPLALLMIALHGFTGLADITLDELGQEDATVTGGTHCRSLELIVRNVVQCLYQAFILRYLLVLLLFKLLERTRARHPVVERCRLAAGIGQVKHVGLLLTIEHQLDVVAQFQVTPDAALELLVALLKALGTLLLLLMRLAQFLTQHAQRLRHILLLEHCTCRQHCRQHQQHQ